MSVVKRIQSWTRGSIYGKKTLLSKHTAAGRKRRKSVAQFAKVNPYVNHAKRKGC